MDTPEWNQRRLLEVSGSYWQTCALHASVKIDVFTRLGDERLTGQEVAERLGGDPRAVPMLLNALVAMNLLARDGERYTNTPASRSFLAKDSEQYIGHMIMHHRQLVGSWSQLAQAVLSGKPVRPRPSYSLEEFFESFLLGMHTLAMQLAPRIVEVVDLSGRSDLLDLGGGPGTYAIHFCLKNPSLRAAVFDLPTSKEIAEQTIGRFGLEDRIDFMEGNYLEDHTLSGSYDAAWLSHILHGEGPQGCRGILEKAVAALRPGGLLVVHEFLLEETLDGPLFPALFSLNMLLGTPDGQAYSEKQIVEMLAGAGLRDLKRLPFQGPNDSGLVVGTV
jgi:SAM-dependent methyltransferase